MTASGNEDDRARVTRFFIAHLRNKGQGWS